MLVRVHHFVTFAEQSFVHDSGNDVSVDVAVGTNDTDVLFVTDHTGNTVHIERRTRFRFDPVTIQSIDDVVQFFAVSVPIEHVSHDVRFKGVYHPSFVHDVIAEESVTADEISFGQALTNTTFDLLGKLGGVILRHTFQYALNQDTACVVSDVLFCGEDAHAVLFEFCFVVCAVISVTSEAIQLIDENEVKGLFLAVFYHL